MTLDTTTFLIVFAAALGVMGIFIWFKLRSEKKKNP